MVARVETAGTDPPAPSLGKPDTFYGGHRTVLHLATAPFHRALEVFKTLVLKT